MTGRDPPATAAGGLNAQAVARCSPPLGWGGLPGLALLAEIQARRAGGSPGDPRCAFVSSTREEGHCAGLQEDQLLVGAVAAAAQSLPPRSICAGREGVRSWDAGDQVV